MCLLDINIFSGSSPPAKEQHTAFQEGEIGTDSTCDTAALSLTDIQRIGLYSNINNSNEIFINQKPLLCNRVHLHFVFVLLYVLWVCRSVGVLSCVYVSRSFTYALRVVI